MGCRCDAIFNSLRNSIMKTLKHKLTVTITFIALAVISGSCRPSVQEVEKVVSTVPLGANRTEVWNALIKAYPKNIYPYQLTTPAHLVTEQMIKADKDLIAEFN